MIHRFQRRQIPPPRINCTALIPRRIRDIGNEANRANVSFYPIDPRGLVLSEQDMQPLGIPNIDLHTSPVSTRADTSACDASAERVCSGGRSERGWTTARAISIWAAP